MSTFQASLPPQCGLSKDEEDACCVSLAVFSEENRWPDQQSPWVGVTQRKMKECTIIASIEGGRGCFWKEGRAGSTDFSPFFEGKSVFLSLIFTMLIYFWMNIFNKPKNHGCRNIFICPFKLHHNFKVFHFLFCVHNSCKHTHTHISHCVCVCVCVRLCCKTEVKDMRKTNSSVHLLSGCWQYVASQSECRNVFCCWKVWTTSRPVQHLHSLAVNPCCCDGCSLWFELSPDNKLDGPSPP